MKRKKMTRKGSKKLFKKTAGLMNSENVPKVARGGIRF